jgi:hypothetical protein
MLASELNVVQDEEFATNRKVIVPENQDQVAESLVAIHDECVAGKFTGKVTVNYSQGGVPNILTEHVQSDLEGLFDDDEDEADDESEEDEEGDASAEKTN